MYMGNKVTQFLNSPALAVLLEMGIVLLGHVAHWEIP